MRLQSPSSEIVHFLDWTGICSKMFYQNLSFLKGKGFSSLGGPSGCIWRNMAASTVTYLLNWICLATLSSPRTVWFPLGNIFLWKLQWGNSFFTSAQESEFNIVWRWDSSSGGGTEHLMSLGTNQKNSREWIPTPTHTFVSQKIYFICLGEWSTHLHSLLSGYSNRYVASICRNISNHIICYKRCVIWLLRVHTI